MGHELTCSLYMFFCSSLVKSKPTELYLKRSNPKQRSTSFVLCMGMQQPDELKMSNLCLCFASPLGLQQNIIIARHAPSAARSLTLISAFLVHSASFFYSPPSDWSDVRPWDQEKMRIWFVLWWILFPPDLTFVLDWALNIKQQTLACSVQLARRVLQLERANTSLRKEIEREKARTKQLAEEVSEQD